MRARVCLLALFALVAPAEATEPLRCDDSLVTVAGAGPELRDRVCTVAASGIRTLSSCNVALTRPVRIEISETLPPGCVGLYHYGKDLIEVLPPAMAAERRAADSPFRTLGKDAYFDSIIVHELVHAGFDTVPCPVPGCPATSEYLAYALQVRSLTPTHVAAFEAAAEIDRPISGAEIDAMLLFMAPNRFAAMAWAHFSARPDPCGYAGLIMVGAIRFDRERP